MRGNYIGKKPVANYDSITSTKPGMWEIYDQGQFVRDSTWASQPWNVNNGKSANKTKTMLLASMSPQDVQFSSDGTNFYSASSPIYQYSCSTAWDLNTATYTQKSFTHGIASPVGLFFKSDGTKFYILGGSPRTIYQYSLSTPWDISTASYDTKSFSVATQETVALGLFFKSDGATFYVVGSTNKTVYQYTCSTAWDISTASYATKSFSVTAQDTAPNGLFFKSDGAKFYIVGGTNSTIYQYSCSTAWDISTASYDTKLFSVLPFTSAPTGACFKSDGTKFFAVSTADFVYEFTLSTAWDISTSNNTGGNFYIGTQETLSADVQFKSDGTKFYIVGLTNKTIYQYSCATAWDVSTASYDTKSFSVNTQETAPNGLFFKDDGTKFYVIGSTNKTVYQYTCSTAWDISTASYDSKSFSVNTQETAPTGVFFKSDGTTFYIIGTTSDTVFQYTCSTAWDVSTASYASKSFSVATQETTPNGLFFKADGTKFYVVGNTNKTVYQYTCSTAWDVSTASYDSKSFSVNTQETAPQGLFFKSDGTRMYIVGPNNDFVSQYILSVAWSLQKVGYMGSIMRLTLQTETDYRGLFFKPDGTAFYAVGNIVDTIFQYNCSNPWDLNTAVFNNQYNGFYSSFPTGTFVASGLFFKPDGTIFYVIDQLQPNTGIRQYTCSTAWDLSTAAYANKQFVAGQEQVPGGFFFKPDGTTFYVVGSINDTVYQYTCSTAWDISTASYASKSFSVVTQENFPIGIFFKDDGTSFYIVGATNSTIYQYSCSTAWDVSTASYASKSLSVAAGSDLSIGYSGTIAYVIGGVTVYQYYLT
jgi:sugar lactone lactonase YvrE